MNFIDNENYTKKIINDNSNDSDNNGYNEYINEFNYEYEFCQMN